MNAKILILLLSLCPYTAVQPARKFYDRGYIIESLKVNEHAVYINIERSFARRFLQTPRFFARYDDADINLKNLDYETVTAPFIMSIISIIWASGDTWHIKSIDAELFKSLRIIKEVYKAFFPKNNWNGKLIADKIVEHQPNQQESQEIGLTFSGGLDSIYTALTFDDHPQTLLTAYGFSEEADGRWQLIKDQVSTFAQDYGNRSNSFVFSNFRSMLFGAALKKRFRFQGRWREYFQESLSLAGISLPILRTKNIKKFYIPSSFNWAYNHPWGSHPYIDNNIRFKDISFENHRYDINRLGKIQFVLEKTKNCWPKPQFHTCRHGEQGDPCVRCIKGAQTASTLLVEGADPQEYGYRLSKEDAMASIKDKLSQEYPYSDFDSTEALEWNYIKNRIHERLTTEELDPKLREFLEWLYNHDFKHFINNSMIYKFPVNFNALQHFLDDAWRQEFLAQRAESRTL